MALLLVRSVARKYTDCMDHNLSRIVLYVNQDCCGRERNKGNVKKCCILGRVAVKVSEALKIVALPQKVIIFTQKVTIHPQ